MTHVEKERAGGGEREKSLYYVRGNESYFDISRIIMFVLLGVLVYHDEVILLL